MSWLKPLAGYRLADTRQGDSLERIALREIGDANRWRDLAQINNLVSPWLTDDPALAGPRVLLAGRDRLQVPATSAPRSGSSDAGDPFGADVALVQGRLAVDAGGDLAVVGSTANLSQALRHALRTDPGELVYHPQYGCMANRLLGKGAGPVNDQLAAFYVKRTLGADRRVASVASSEATVTGDAVEVVASVVTVLGMQIPVGGEVDGVSD